MLNKAKNSVKEYGLIKVLFISIGSFIGFIGLMITMTFFLLLWMDKYDNRYLDSEEGMIEFHQEELSHM